MFSIGGVIGTIIIIICVAYCIVQHVQNRDVKKQYAKKTVVMLESIEQKNKSVQTLFKMLEKLTDEKAYYKKRVEDLEDSIESGFGLSVRKDITIINTDLLKIDYVAMLAGIIKLIKDTVNLEDTEYYIGLTKKIQLILDKMPEIQEEKGASEITHGV